MTPVRVVTDVDLGQVKLQWSCAADRSSDHKLNADQNIYGKRGGKRPHSPICCSV